MACYRRPVIENAIYHAISRVVAGEFRIDNHARRMYLALTESAADRSTWRILAYAIMSNHIHWILECMGDPLANFFRRIHSPFGSWLNERDHRGGQQLFRRPSSWIFDASEAARLITYAHNNPVRARQAMSADQSNWSSHRYYIDADEPPPWLHVSRGLQLCGLSDDAVGRRRFHELTRACEKTPRDGFWEADQLVRARREVRRQLNAPVELGTPTVNGDQAAYPVLGCKQVIVQTWEAPIELLLNEVANETSFSLEDLRSRSRQRRLSRARKLVLVTGYEYLGRALTELGISMGLSVSAASRLLCRNMNETAELRPLANDIAVRLRASSA